MVAFFTLLSGDLLGHQAVSAVVAGDGVWSLWGLHVSGVSPGARPAC